MSALLSHHAAAGSLATLMSDISEEVFAAGWIQGCEWTLWNLWVDCPDCEGMGGWVDGDGDWVDCPKCEGAEGWMEPAS